MGDLNGDQFYVGMKGILGNSWNAGMPHVKTYPGAVPFEHVEHLIGFRPLREEMPYQYADREQPDVMLVHPETKVLLGVHSSDYPETDYVDRLVTGTQRILDEDAKNLQIMGAGLLAGGRQAFVQIMLSEDVKAAMGDKFRPYLLVFGSFDGSLSNSWMTGFIRSVCRNTFGMARKEKGAPKYSYRNTKYNRVNVLRARDVLEIFDAMNVQLMHLVEQQSNTTVTDRQWTAILDRAFPIDPKLTAKGKTRREGVRADVDRMYRSDERVGFVGTQWGAFQALTTYYQHAAMIRGGEEQRLSNNFDRLLRGRTDTFEAEVAELIESVIGKDGVAPRKRPARKAVATV